MLEGYNSRKVQDASFGYDAESQDPERLFLFLDILTDDPENGEGGVVRERYTMGQGWTTPDRGATAVHESNKPRKFNNNSGIGLLADSLVAAIGMDAAMKLGPTTDADTWRKLGELEWHRKEFSMKGENGEDVNYSRMLIVKALDANAPASDVSAASASAPATTADASAAIDAAASTTATFDCPPVLKVKLKKFAAESDTHDAFAEKAFALEGVADVAAMEEKVAEEGFYLWLKALG